MLPDFVFVTGNPNKVVEAERILGRTIEILDLDLPEIQSLDLGQVLRAKADEAARHIDGAFVVEEAALEVHSMNGFPGPLVKWMLTAIGPDGLARLALASGDATVTTRCQLLFRDGDRECLGEGVSRGTLVAEHRGSHGFGWDPFLIPEGESRTLGELPDEAKYRISHRGRAWRDLVSKLEVG